MATKKRKLKSRNGRLAGGTFKKVLKGVVYPVDPNNNKFGNSPDYRGTVVMVSETQISKGDKISLALWVEEDGNEQYVSVRGSIKRK